MKTQPVDYRAAALAPGFYRGYLMSACWTTDEHAPSGDYEASGRFDEFLPLLDERELEQAYYDCAAFERENESALRTYGEVRSMEHAGHDFWLTRNGHGSGFWDRDGIDEDTLQVLTDACRKFGEVWLTLPELN